MSSPNMKLRDPLLYRITHARAPPHAATPGRSTRLYDFAHGQSDAIEGITHSLCTLEFEDHRPLYDWLVDSLPVADPPPHQTEFARLNLTYTVLSKRKLLELVERGLVAGWDDPRLPTIAGLRRRGFPRRALRDFATVIGVAKADSIVEVDAAGILPVRGCSTRKSRGCSACCDPLKLVIENYPEDQVEEFEAPLYPPGPAPAGHPQGAVLAHPVHRARRLHGGAAAKVSIRLAPGPRGPPALRLFRHAATTWSRTRRREDRGGPLHLRPRLPAAARRRTAARGRATLHWVSAAQSLPVEVRLYDRLFVDRFPGADGREPVRRIDPASRDGPPAVPSSNPLVGFGRWRDVSQFERLATSVADPDSTGDHLVFNRTVTLKDMRRRLGPGHEAA